MCIGLFAQSFIVESHPNGQNYPFYKELSGSWQNSVAKSAADYLTPGVGSRFTEYVEGRALLSKALIAPVFESGGIYEVLITWGQSGNAQNIKYVVQHADGQQVRYLDQDGWGAKGSSNKDKWISLGQFRFSAGAGQSVTIDCTEVTGPVFAQSSARIYVDSVYFKKLKTSPVALNTPQSYSKPENNSPFVEVNPSQPSNTYNPGNYGQNSSKWLTDYNQALSQARSSNRKMLIYFYMDIADACKEYDSYFQSYDMKSALSQYVKVKINIMNNRNMSSQFKIYRVPALVITDSQGMERSRISKKKTKAELKELLR